MTFQGGQCPSEHGSEKYSGDIDGGVWPQRTQDEDSALGKKPDIRKAFRAVLRWSKCLWLPLSLRR